MGNKKNKVDKQTRSTHIEGLRKRYETLLLEDKKRKERNEYILETMNKMQKCTAVAQPNSKHNFQDQLSFIRPSSINNLRQAKVSDVDVSFYRTLHHRAPDMFAHTNATLMLKEIYNNYILIPKRQQTENSPRADTLKFINTNDTNIDWKSKYDILNKLKQEEKEDLGSNRTGLAQAELEEHHQFFGDSSNEIYAVKLPERHISRNDVTLEDKNNDDDIFNEIKPTVSPVNDLEKRISFNSIRTADKVSPSDKSINNKANNSPPESTEVNPKPVEVNNESANINPLSKIDGSEKIEYLDDDDGINPAHISYPSDNLGKPFGEVPENVEDVQYPIDPINLEDFTPRDDVVVQDGINVNPEGYKLSPTHFGSFSSHGQFISPEDVIVKDGVKINNEEFNMSQESVLETPTLNPKTEKGGSNKEHDNNPEMLYTSEEFKNEPRVQTVPVPEQIEDLSNLATETEQDRVLYQAPISEIAYDHNISEDTWAPIQNENYMQNEPYYYDETHEQETVQINEHEETSTPYDPNYEQQYMADYEQQEYPEAFQPQDQEAYNQPEYEQGYAETGPAIYAEEIQVEQFNPVQYQEQYRQDNYQSVEEVLNQEEGYVVMQNEEHEEPKVTAQQQPQT